MRDIIVSIIIPIYRVEPYIYDCIMSIMTQDYKHLDVVVVNDNTDDRSMEICEDLVRGDTRFQLINLDRNVGVGIARDVGMKYAKGEYIYFLDSDDILNERAISRLVEKLEKNTDIVEAECTILKDGIKIGDWKKQSAFDDINMYSCHLYRKCFLNSNNITFPEWRVAQDLVFALNVVVANPQIVRSDIKSFSYCRYTKRFNRNRYSTDLVKEHVRAEMDMLDCIVNHNCPQYAGAVDESIGRMIKSVRSMLDHMDIIELAGLEHVTKELKEKIKAFNAGYKDSVAIDIDGSLDKLLEDIIRETLIKSAYQV